MMKQQMIVLHREKVHGGKWSQILCVCAEIVTLLLVQRGVFIQTPPQYSFTVLIKG